MYVGQNSLSVQPYGITPDQGGLPLETLPVRDAAAYRTDLLLESTITPEAIRRAYNDTATSLPLPGAGIVIPAGEPASAGPEPTPESSRTGAAPPPEVVLHGEGDTTWMWLALGAGVLWYLGGKK